MVEARREDHDQLIDRARTTARQMAKAAAGRETTVNAEMPLSLFFDISKMLEQLADAATLPSRPDRETAALRRIAELDIRSGSELLELGAWKRIASELQAIAQEALGRARTSFDSARRSRDDARSGGIGY